MIFLSELLAFMRARQKFWLYPLLIMTVLLGGVVMLAQGSALAPFIYALF